MPAQRHRCGAGSGGCRFVYRDQTRAHRVRLGEFQTGVPGKRLFEVMAGKAQFAEFVVGLAESVVGTCLLFGAGDLYGEVQCRSVLGDRAPMPSTRSGGVTETVARPGLAIAVAEGMKQCQRLPEVSGSPTLLAQMQVKAAKIVQGVRLT